MLKRIGHTIHYGWDAGKDPIVNNVRASVNSAAVGRMFRTLTCGDSDRLGASQADLAELIGRTAIGNYRFDALAVFRVRHYGAASHHYTRDSLDDHRRHDHEWRRGGINIFERGRTRQRLSICTRQMERGRRNVSPRTRIIRSLDNRRPVVLPSVRHDAVPVPRTASIPEVMLLTWAAKGLSDPLLRLINVVGLPMLSGVVLPRR